jgi:error-prone DNA polymerase
MASGSLTRPGQYVELHAHSCFSLLDAVPFPEELVNRAAALGQTAIALTDHDALSGLVPFYFRALEVGVKPILGAELTLTGNQHLTLLAENDLGYQNLCRLISAGRLARPKGESLLDWATLASHTEGLICLTGCKRGPLAQPLLRADPATVQQELQKLLGMFGAGQVFLELQRNLGRDDGVLSRSLVDLGQSNQVPCVATGNVHYLTPADADLETILISIRERSPLPEMEENLRPVLSGHAAGLWGNREYYLRSASEMVARFSDVPEAISNTLRIAERCNAKLPTGLQTLPQFPTPGGMTADGYLRQLCEASLPRYYQENYSEAQALLEKELGIITRLRLSNYFLIIWDIINFCKQQDILCHGRGSAANSLVSRLLGISAVDPLAQGLVIERFLSVEHGGTPDVDLDIDAFERERVIQYVYARWSGQAAGLVDTPARTKIDLDAGAVSRSADPASTTQPAPAKCSSITRTPRARIADPLSEAQVAKIEKAGAVETSSPKIGDPLNDIHTAIEHPAVEAEDPSAWITDPLSDIHTAITQQSSEVAELISRSADPLNDIHTAMACTYITYRSASALRDAGYALGFNEQTLSEISAALQEERYQEELDDDGQEETPEVPIPEVVERIRTTNPKLASIEWARLIEVAEQLRGRPRHLGLHNGAMIVTGEPLTALLPVEPATMPNRRVVQFDKKWLEMLGIVKIDLLGLRMLSALATTRKLVRRERGLAIQLDLLGLKDERVYRFIRSGRTIGIFQVESGAQISIIDDLRPLCYEDLIVEVSLVRPGPLQGHMVQPFLLRRKGLAPVTYLHPLLENALRDTLGVLVFQEQVILIARDFAGFTAERGDSLRRALGDKNAVEALAGFQAEFIQGALAREVTRSIIDQVWTMIENFAGYSFSKAHASAFALIVYWSAWLRVYYPLEYFCALLRHSPLGTYPPNVLESEARRSNLRFLPFDINYSSSEAEVEESAIRYGLDYVKGIGTKRAKEIVEQRADRPFTSLLDFIQRTDCDRRSAESLILAGAFDSFGERRQILASLPAALRQAHAAPMLPLDIPSERPTLRPMSEAEKLGLTFATTGVTAGVHLVELQRPAFKRAGCWPYPQLFKTRLGSKVKVGGLVAEGIRRPKSAHGRAFIRLDTPEGMIDISISKELYLKFHTVLHSRFLVVEGILDKQHPILSVRLLKAEALLESPAPFPAPRTHSAHYH